MNDMKCPFCNKQLQPTLRQPDEYWCENYDCPVTNIKWVGSQKLWQELIRTRKALDKAKWWLNEIVESHRHTPISTAEMALKEITALEQKGE
ncbi:MAG: hypothetical protein MJZ20_02815 [Bacteroidaceae bacterium]|nr:hypothetical protein [Bacteroidaceae bacterium]